MNIENKYDVICFGCSWGLIGYEILLNSIQVQDVA